MIMAIAYTLAFALLSAGVWIEARAARGRWSGVVAALVLLLALAVLDGLGRFAGLPSAAGLTGLMALIVDTAGTIVSAAEALAGQLMPALPAGLGIQLVVLAAYFLLRGAAALLANLLRALRWLWRRLRRRGPVVMPPAADDAGRSALLRAIQGTLLLLGALLVLSPLAHRAFPALNAPHGQLLWIGAWVLLLELGGRLSAQRRRPGAGGLRAQATRARPVDALRGLYRRTIDEHREALFLCRVQPPAEAGLSAVSAPAGGSAALLYARLAPILSPALLERLLTPARHHDAGGDLLLGESLCAHHFLLISELIQGTINAGRGVLVLCPAAALPEVRHSLDLHRDSNLRHLGQRWAELGRDPLIDGVHQDLLICPDNALEQSLFHELDRLRPRIERLGLLVCLDIQALAPPSLVRFALARLYAVAGGHRRLRLLMQGAACAQLETLARSLYAGGALRELRIQAQLTARRYVLVWDRNAPEAAHRERRLPGLQQPVGLDCLLMIPAWQQGLGVARLDPGNRHDEDAIERFRGHLPEHGHADLAAIAAAHVPVSHGFISGGAAVSLLDDPGNLLIALDHDGGSNGRVASMIQILCGNYLLRDYLRAVAAAADRPPLALRPLAPRPRGNPYTLAHCLLNSLADGRGMTAAELQTQLFGLVSRQLLHRLQIGIDRAGLQRLLDLAYADLAPPVLVHWPPRGERRYRISAMQRPPLADWAEVQNEQGEVIGRLLRWDHGLTYAVGQTLMLRHKRHRVVAVDAQQVRVRHADSALGQARRREVCDRRYRLRLPHPALLEQDPLRRHRPGGPALTLRCGYLDMHRETRGWISVDDACRPFATTPPDLQHSPCEPPIRWRFRFQGVTHLRIEPASAAEASAQTGPTDGRLAFTLCALIQDALHSLFPEHHRQLAVVSPQSAHPSADGAPMAAFLAHWYPRLEQIDGLDPINPGGIDLFIIEDSRFDLGVARALGDWQGLDQLLTGLRLYLEWLLGRPDADAPPVDAFHAFGADGLDPAFDHAAARDLLAELITPATWPTTVAAADACAPPPPADDGDDPSHCDFCAAPIGTDYDRFDDGRCRCRRCGDDAIDSIDAFRGVYREVRERMERHYRIALPRDLELRFVDAPTLARAAERRFIPTAGLDARAVGLAIRSEGGRLAMLIENGAPRLSTLATLAHEFTHLWQLGLGLGLRERHRPLIEAQARLVEIDLLRQGLPQVPGAATLAAALNQQARGADPTEAEAFERLRRVCRPGRGLFRCLEMELRGVAQA